MIVSGYIWNDVLLPQNLDTKLPKSLITKYYLLFDDLTTISFDRKSNCIAKNYYLSIKPLNWCISFFFSKKKNFFQKFRTKISRSFRSTSPTCTSSSSGTRSSSNESRLWQTTPSEKSDQKSKSSSSKCSSTVTTKTNLIQVTPILKIPSAHLRKDPGPTPIRHHRHSHSSSSTDTGSSRENDAVTRSGGGGGGSRYRSSEEVRDESEVVISSYTAKSEKPRHHHHHHHRHKHRPREESTSAKSRYWKNNNPWNWSSSPPFFLSILLCIKLTVWNNKNMVQVSKAPESF